MPDGRLWGGVVKYKRPTAARVEQVSHQFWEFYSALKPKDSPPRCSEATVKALGEFRVAIMDLLHALGGSLRYKMYGRLMDNVQQTRDAFFLAEQGLQTALAQDHQLNAATQTLAMEHFGSITSELNNLIETMMAKSTPHRH